LENLAKVVRSHIDAVLQLFEEGTFERKRQEALARIDARRQARVEVERQT
jgi:hypothetical protein